MNKSEQRNSKGRDSKYTQSEQNEKERKKDCTYESSGQKVENKKIL